MKKILILLSSLLVVLTLVGCSNKHESSPKIPETINGQLAAYNKKISALRQNEPLPQEIKNPTKLKYLAITDQGTKNNFQINYGFSNKYTDFGKSPAEDFNTVARFVKKTYGNAQLAEKDLKYLDGQKVGGKANFDLGNGQKAYMLRDSTHLYLLWNQENYSILISANSTKGEKPEETAKKLFTLLKTASLPKTTKGSLVVQVTANNDTFDATLNWQDSKEPAVIYGLMATTVETLISMTK